MYKNNPIYVNKMILVDDVQLAALVKLLTTAEDVTIHCEDIGKDAYVEPTHTER